ncbi:hypothetical protein [Saccharibacillus sp. JS10]|uniref:hypothetical protein n=1 Tax=Saccharibacillus sp. JS10 TaxID=2950552 RepID=UPI00210AA403|nr:hypothetical protein [Saccharibacillus sp. JS10]MCQ4087537.1 hypothetical protein [Saccharibacillus sp. JS10]
MLLIEAEIYFDTLSENPNALKKDLETRHILRASFNLGNDQLFSGDILAAETEKVIYRGKSYNAFIKLFTEEEAYTNISYLIQIGNSFFIQTPSKVVGRGTIIDYVYEECIK